MKNRTISIILIIAVLAAGAGIWAKTRPTNSTLQTVSVALDWTPNTNHTGMYVAQQKGWYKNAGINLKLLPYSESVAAETLVSTGKAEVGISSTESIVAASASGAPVVGIGAIVSHNTSVLAVRKDSGITSPKQLDGKTYGGFGASFETPLINKVIQQDGGTGSFKNVTLSTDSIQALQSRKVDFVWIYEGWESIIAKRAGLELTTFPITKYGVPDYSTPDFVA